MRRLTAIAALSLALISPGVMAHAQDSSAPQTATEAPPLSMEECQVWAALGRAVLGWGAKPADEKQFVIFYRPEGDTYVEQCPWSKLGVTPPPMQAPNLDDIQFFGMPVIQDGGQTAVVSKTIRLKGSRPGVFIEMDMCVLKKAKWEWTLDKCTMAAIT